MSTDTSKALPKPAIDYAIGTAQITYDEWRKIEDRFQQLIILEENVKAILGLSKHAVRVCEGGGPEDLAMSIAISFAKVEGEVARLKSLINSPQIVDFVEAVKNEAAHQRERWGVDHDAGKEDTDWLFLIGFLGGKAVEAGREAECMAGRDLEMQASLIRRQLHHIIAAGAAVLNWHAARSGGDNRMRPGIAPPQEPVSMTEQTAPESERSGNA